MGPKRSAGSIRATMTPATAYAPTSPPRRFTSAATATNPTQSPSDDIVCAARSLENAGCVRRSLKVAGCVPRRAATSSTMVVNYPSATARAVRFVAGAFFFFAAVFFFAVAFFLVAFFAVAFFAVAFFAVARAARAAALAARASASARGSPGFVTWNSGSSSAPQFQQRYDFGRRTSSEPHSGQGWSATGGLLTAKSQSG